MVSGQSVRFPGRKNSLPEGQVDRDRQKEGRLTDTLQQQTEKWQHYTDTVNKRGGSPIIIQTQSAGLIACLVFKSYWQFISHITAELLTRPLLPVNGCNRPLLDNLRTLSKDFYRATPVETGDRVFGGFIRMTPPPPIPSLLTTPKSYMWS